jgi:hypothetical protein
MLRHFLVLLLLPLLPACQNAAPRQSAAASTESPSPPTFNQETVQTYDLQTGEFQQQPPFGDRSNGSQ